MKHNKHSATSKLTQTLLILGYIIAAACQYLPIKAMNKLKVPVADKNKPIYFYHPFIQIVFMFVGNLLCLSVIIAQQLISQCQNKHNKKPKQNCCKLCLHEFVHCFFPSMCAFVSNVLYTFSIYYIPPSFQANLKTFSVIVVALASATILTGYRDFFDIPQLISTAFIIIFLIAISVLQFYFDNNIISHRNTIIGIFLSIIGSCFNGYEYDLQEKHIKHTIFSSAFVVFLEGVWCILFCIVLFPLCNRLQSNNILQHIQQWFYQVTHSKYLYSLHYFLLLFSFISEYLGMQINLYMSSSARVTFGSLKFVIVWIVSLLVNWEKWNNVYQISKVMLYIVLLVSVLIFNNVWKIIPFKKYQNIVKYGKSLRSRMKSRNEKFIWNYDEQQNIEQVDTLVIANNDKYHK